MASSLLWEPCWSFWVLVLGYASPAAPSTLPLRALPLTALGTGKADRPAIYTGHATNASRVKIAHVDSHCFGLS